MSVRRSPNTASRSSSKQTQQQKSHVELVTYRLNDEMVYVHPSSDFEVALNHAQTVFPQLADVARERIAFFVNVRVAGMIRTVRIAPMAWERVLKSLSTYEIIDLSILPLASTSHAAKSDTNEYASAFDRDIQTSFSEDEPPTYGGPGFKLDEGSDNSLLGADLRNTEKSPHFTLQQPPSPASRRCMSPMGWFGKHR